MIPMPYWMVVAITIICSVWIVVETVIFVFAILYKSKYTKYERNSLIACFVITCFWFCYLFLSWL